MSLSMLIGWLLLPGREKYHLPPRLITEEIAERVGLEKHMNESQLVAATVASHFAYGALFGALYALYEGRLSIPSGLKGAFVGVAVWVGSHLGWLPAMNTLAPATRHPWRRNLMMILAHIVWGVSLGEMTRKLTSSD
jgi:putative membrane protein